MAEFIKNVHKKILIILVVALTLSGCADTGHMVENPDLTERFSEIMTQVTTAAVTEANQESIHHPDTSVAGLLEPIKTWNGANEIPAYDGKPWVELADGIPYFSENEMTTTVFESYSDLDSLGRCGQAYANICKELMPTEERGQIGQVKPSGWHTVKYPDIISDRFLYNRCHLIGYQLGAENANEKNLITGTRSMNIDGMLDFENQIADYVKKTDNHVLYRVTPLFYEEDLVCRGVEMEAYSIEDDGEGIRFHVFAYNVQPGITIDYKTGDSWVTTKSAGSDEPSADESNNLADQETREYALNISTMKFHLPQCESVPKMKKKNLKYWTCTREELIEDGYSPCGICNP